MSTLKQFITREFPTMSYEDVVVGLTSRPTQIALSNDLFREGDRDKLVQAIDKNGNALSRSLYGEFIVESGSKDLDERSALYGLAYLCNDTFMPIVYARLSDIEPEFFENRVSGMNFEEADKVSYFVEQHGTATQLKVIDSVMKENFENQIGFYEY